jgi:hypothetical protein
MQYCSLAISLFWERNRLQNHTATWPDGWRSQADAVNLGVGRQYHACVTSTAATAAAVLSQQAAISHRHLGAFEATYLCLH